MNGYGKGGAVARHCCRCLHHLAHMFRWSCPVWPCCCPYLRILRRLFASLLISPYFINNSMDAWASILCSFSSFRQMKNLIFLKICDFFYFSIFWKFPIFCNQVEDHRQTETIKHMWDVWIGWSRTAYISSTPTPMTIGRLMDPRTHQLWSCPTFLTLPIWIFT